MKETWYVWRVLAKVEGEKTKRLLVPWADPMKHEFAFDFLFDTPEKAREGLKTWGAEEDAEEEGWKLCRLALEVVEVNEDLEKLKAALDVGGLQAVNPRGLLTAEELRLYLGYATLFKLKRFAVTLLTDPDPDTVREMSKKEELIDYIVKGRFGDES